MIMFGHINDRVNGTQVRKKSYCVEPCTSMLVSPYRYTYYMHQSSQLSILYSSAYNTKRNFTNAMNKVQRAKAIFIHAPIPITNNAPKWKRGVNSRVSGYVKLIAQFLSGHEAYVARVCKVRKNISPAGANTFVRKRLRVLYELPQRFKPTRTHIPGAARRRNGAGRKHEMISGRTYVLRI